MVRREDVLTHKHMLEGEQRAFDRWITRNVVVGSILAGGLLCMALVGSGASISPRQAGAQITELSASQKHSDQGAPSAFELMSRASDQLRVRPVDEPAF
jgi:hypothetical protein